MKIMEEKEKTNKNYMKNKENVRGKTKKITAINFEDVLI